MSSERPTSPEDAAARANTAHLNPAQLRSDIDSGATRDKVAHSDPAAAPLETDSEAAGAPLETDSEAAGAPIDSRAAALERGGATNRGPVDASVHGSSSQGRSRLFLVLLALIAIGVVIAIWQMAA